MPQQNGNLPAVSFVKAPKFQNGHPGYSNPSDEQNFLGEYDKQLAKITGME